MAKINDLPLLSNPTEDMYCLVGKEDLHKVPWSAIMGQIGAPYIATTVAGMTDKTRVYVYQGSESGYTSGNWYYWNGSAWTSGGIYNSAAVDTDKTLTQSDKPADSAIVGKEVGSLKESLDYLNIDNNAGQSLTSEKDISGKYVIFNTQYKLLGFNVDKYQTCKVYKVAKNKKYYAIGYGRKDVGFPVAVFSENLVEDGTTPYTDYILGELSTISLSKVSFIAKNDGYIYVNCRNAVCGLYENIVIPESTKNTNDIKKY